ncbi:MAG TPA: hypothetical protein IAA19_03140 [Candidatus Olsenella pullistercoris]|uniref:DUF948 domain-containing protein n=1 Tax=Candidatus Olsenella pullistercoris TaxID=2838712 RepID=A0A9D2JDV8_9ACTN|nr:hypothetical protein [Candidatus Olsenella pullistercoris]
MDYLQIALIVLVVAGVWAVVELALTMRATRRDVGRVCDSAREVVEQAQPVVAKLDGIADELEPAAKQVAPLLRQAGVAVESANASLGRLNGILDDVSSVSGAASSVTGAVNRVAESAASGVAGMVSRLKGGRPADAPARLDGALSEEPVREQEPSAPTRYVDYADIAASSEKGDARPSQGADEDKDKSTDTSGADAPEEA